MKLEYNEGDLILFTDGCYSDYMPHGLVKVLKPFNIKDYPAIQDYEEKKKQGKYLSGSVSMAIANMIKDGVVEEVNYYELNHCYFHNKDVDNGFWGR